MPAALSRFGTLAEFGSTLLARWPIVRGIEWSLRAFANMRAVCLFLRARAVVKFFLRAASTLEKYTEMASSENFEYFVNFPLAGISLVLIGYVVLRQVIANNLAHTSKTEQQMQNWCGSTSCSILQSIVPPACLVKFLYGKQPLLWPLLRKKTYTTVSFP